MTTRPPSIAALVIAAVLACAPSTLSAAPFVVATDLSDSSPGVDLWRYVYTLDDEDLEAGQGLSIFFDQERYGPLFNPTPDTDRDLIATTDSDWDVLLLDPDVNLLAPGVFDALALVSGSHTRTFSVDFVWLGAGAPGTQSYYTYALDADQFPVVIETGTTVMVQSVPEPPTLSLALLGLAGSGLARLRRRAAHADV